MRPDEAHGLALPREHSFSFISTRALAPNVDFATTVGGEQCAEDSWPLQVRGMIYDRRVWTLNSDIVGFDTSHLPALEFDVLAASSAMNGETISDLPVVRTDTSTAEIASHLEDYSRRIDRIWDFFGGASIANLVPLAIWMIQHRGTVGADDLPGLPTICAAYVYGERELSLCLLDELEMDWQRRLQTEPDELAEEGNTLASQLLQLAGQSALADLARLRIVIDRSRFH
jgi:hypothetical protein